MTVEYLHDSRKLGRVVIELLQQRCGLFIPVASIWATFILTFSLGHFFGFDLSLESLIDRLVSVNDEGDDDVYEDQIGKLHERDEVKEDGWVFLIVIDDLVHEDNSLPIVLPHHAK